MADPIYRAPAPLIDEQYEAIIGEPMPLPDAPSPDTEHHPFCGGTHFDHGGCILDGGVDDPSPDTEGGADRG